jgi:hypothetical protein
MRTWVYVGRPAIRLAWFGLVLPALVLCYFGQGARVLVDPKAIESPFYSLAPGWAVIPMVVLAALATIITSQALISGVFFDDPAGDSDGAVPALQNHSNFERRSRPSLSSHRKL